MARIRAGGYTSLKVTSVAVYLHPAVKQSSTLVQGEVVDNGAAPDAEADEIVSPAKGPPNANPMFTAYRVGSETTAREWFSLLAIDSPLDAGVSHVSVEPERRLIRYGRVCNVVLAERNPHHNELAERRFNRTVALLRKAC